MHLVAYAGKDYEQEANPKRGYAYDRFINGATTLQIADYYRMSEATVLRWITEERCARRGLKSPYGFQP